MSRYKIIIDTNVLLSGLRSNQGASFRLLSRLRDSRIELFLSNSMIFEYEDVLKRNRESLGMNVSEIDSVIDDLCALSTLKNIFFLWRPSALDPGDDFIVDLAVAAGIDFIITFNVSNFVSARRMGIQIIKPQEFLRILGD